MLRANDVEVPLDERRPTNAFSQRGIAGNLSPNNAAAIDQGLAYLARVQLDDGSWQFDNLRGTVDSHAESVMVRDDATATGLALLAFLGAGHDHFDGRYRLVVEDGLHFLVQIQRQHGEFLRRRRCTGRTDHAVLQPRHRHARAVRSVWHDGRPATPCAGATALDYLAGTQNPGIDGWRYLPGMDCDASVIGWQLAALRSGQLAGLSVRPETMARISECLATSRDTASRAGQQAGNAQASPRDTVTTAVGLAVELHLGGSPGDERLRPAAKELLANPPEVGDAASCRARRDANESSQHDTYYWYYGSQAMHYLGGDDWQTWSQQLYPKLIQSQIHVGPVAGSWDPPRTAPNKWSSYGGRLYVTAMNLLSLEIQNRQLPLKAAAANPPIAAPRDE